MKSNIKVPEHKPIVPHIPEEPDPVPFVETPSRFRKKKQFVGPTTSIYNNNFTKMPKNF